MSCGLTRIVSRIKHMIFFSFSKKYRPFEHLKCHECLWCKYFDDCKQEFDYARSFETDEIPAEDEWYCVGTPFSKNRTKRIK